MKKLIYLLPLLIVACTTKPTEEVLVVADTVIVDSPKVVITVDTLKVDTVKK